MTIQESKAQIISGLQQNNIDILVQKLAEFLVENESLRKKIEELKPKDAVNP